MSRKRIFFFHSCCRNWITKTTLLINNRHTEGVLTTARLMGIQGVGVWTSVISPLWLEVGGRVGRAGGSYSGTSITDLPVSFPGGCTLAPLPKPPNVPLCSGNESLSYVSKGLNHTTLVLLFHLLVI